MYKRQTQNGLALFHALDALKNDSEIVLAAVTQDGRALELASGASKNDRKIVLAAVLEVVSYTHPMLTTTYLLLSALTAVSR